MTEIIALGSVKFVEHNNTCDPVADLAFCCPFVEVCSHVLCGLEGRIPGVSDSKPHWHKEKYLTFRVVKNIDSESSV